MKVLSDFIVKPLITEKSYAEAKANRFTFLVAKKATKIDIKRAIEKLFSVTVKSVSTARIKRSKIKQTRHGRVKIDTGYKKARVVLPEGQKIDIFEEKTS